MTTTIRDGATGQAGRDGKDVLNGKVNPQPNQGKMEINILIPKPVMSMLKTMETGIKKATSKALKGTKVQMVLKAKKETKANAA